MSGKSEAEYLQWVIHVVSINRVDLFYNSRPWRRKRKDILKAAHWDCERCKRRGKASEATVAHHIKPLRQYPMLAMTDSNLMPVCEECHYRIHHPAATQDQWNDERW